MKLQSSSPSAVAISGATGFVGAALVNTFSKTPLRRVVALSRHGLAAEHANVEHVFYDLLSPVDIEPSLRGVDCVVHLAARVHVMNESAANPLDAFRLCNVAATVDLARQAASAGVKRFIFVSSIKVNGETTAAGAPYTCTQPPAPQDAYGVSKLEAEQALRALAAATGMDVVIIRPVLVYGPGVKANFRSMMNWLAKGIPLPFGAIDNKRSLVALENLVDLIVTCIEHPAAANQTFLVSDGEDVSTSDLLRRMAKALGRPARLLPLPAWLLRSAAGIAGKRAMAQRLCGSLQVDITKTKTLLNWTPPVTLDEALQRTADDFLEHRSS